jgi:hypothetical protein
VSGILSAISGQFSKSLILGTLLPVTFFLGVNLVATLSIIPAGSPIALVLETHDVNWQIVVLTFIALVLSGTLYTLNVPLVRLYEGYPWKDSWIGQRRVEKYRKAMLGAQARWRGLRTLMYAWTPTEADAARRTKCEGEWIRYGREVNLDFPARAQSILPTRLGNVIRSFEHYPDRQYNMSAITLWPRLVAKIDKEYATALDDSKTGVDFTINCSFLSSVTAGLIFVIGLLYPWMFADAAARIWWILEIALAIVVALAFYRMAVGRAQAWGDMVKGAFDLYRRPLLADLGYTRVPSTLRAEREIWDDISNQLLYGDSPRVRTWEFTQSSTYAQGIPDSATIEISSGVHDDAAGELRTVTIRAVNKDSNQRAVADVVITHAVADGWDLVWGTAKCGGSAAEFSGTNPYRFAVGHLLHGRSASISFQLARSGGRTKENKG